jgi:phospholipid/cholesterol/gamma-HCH transport system permease protein
VGGGVLFGKLLLHVELASFYHSLVDNLKPWDFLVGVIKSGFFGLAIALTSCHFGTSVKGGAVGVGRAVNDAVVAAALAIMISDYLLTLVLR